MHAPMCRRQAIWVLAALFAVLQASSALAGATRTELAGNPRTQFPFFEYVRAFNRNAPVSVAIDPTRFPAIVGQTCDAYVVSAKSTAQWVADPSLADVTSGGSQARSFAAGTIQANTFQVAGPLELSADAGAGLGVGYDVVLDCDRNGTLGDPDFIDGSGDEAGFYAVHDTTAPGPYAVTEVLYSIPSNVAATFGISDTRRAEDLYYPTNIGSMGQLPLIMIGRGNGHNYQWYDHIGNHMASYGYIVVSHDNHTEPGPESAASTTLGHTDAFIDQAAAGAIAGGALVGHVDATRITWIGHSRGAEGVAIAYDKLFDGSHTPTHYSLANIRLISSMLPTDFGGTGVADPHGANYHLWTASGDDDVDGSAGCDLCQTFHIHDRATAYRQSTVVQGTGHAWFHDGPESPSWFAGPCSIGPTNDLTHLIELGLFLPLIKHYVEGNVPALDFLTRQYESFRPIGVPTANACIVVSNEYRNASPAGNFVIDDYQSQPNSGISSSGGQVNFDVENLSEDRLDDTNQDYAWSSADPFNGATQASATDTSRGVVFDWTNQDRFYEWELTPGRRNFSPYTYLSFRGAQGTQHPNTLAAPGDLTFTVTLRDVNGATSSINIGAYGGGLEQPYARNGGWHNEMETVRIRLTDFLNNGSALNLGDIAAVRLNVGPSWGSSRGRIVVDDLTLTNDRPPAAPAIPILRISDTTLDYGDVELGFAFTKALVLHNDGNANLTVTARVTTPTTDPNRAHWSSLSEALATVTIAPGASPLILPEVYEPTALGPHNIQMEVTSNDPLRLVQPIFLTGVGVTPIPVDTVLVLDRSGSMQDPAGDRLKIDALRDAAMLYTDLLRTDIGGTGTGDKLGLWKYNHQNSQYRALGFVNDADKAAIAASELSDAALTDSGRLKPQGNTGIGGAMQNAAGAIGGPLPDRKQVMVVLTDGIENVSPYIMNVLGPIESANPDLQLYSVGLGSNIEATKLQEITNMGNEGYHQVSDSLAGESVYDLETFYFKIFSNATGMDLVVDPTHVVNLTNPNPIVIDSARIVSSDRSANFLVLDDPALRGFYDLEFVSPTGQVILPGVTIGGIPIHQASRNTYTIYRIVFPDLSEAASYVGDWLLRLTPNGKWTRERAKAALAESEIDYSTWVSPFQGLVPIGFAAAVASNYRLDVAVMPDSYLPGADVRLEGRLTDRGWPSVQGNIHVTVTAPDGSTHALDLYDDGSHSDPVSTDGTWSNRFAQTALPGTYKFFFQSVGYNERGELAPREDTRYATLKQPERTPDPAPCVSCALWWIFIAVVLLLLLLLLLCCYRKRTTVIG